VPDLAELNEQFGSVNTNFYTVTVKDTRKYRNHEKNRPPRFNG